MIADLLLIVAIYTSIRLWDICVERIDQKGGLPGITVGVAFIGLTLIILITGYRFFGPGSDSLQELGRQIRESTNP